MDLDMSFSSRSRPRLFIVAFATLFASFAAGSAFAQATAPASEPQKAEAAKAPEPDYTLTGNFGIYSQYIFRGLTQTDEKPAFQGGFDYANKNGLYVGTWGSNISWLHDSGVCAHGCSLEWDIYGGWKYAFNDDWGMDLGIYYYWYPGSYNPGVTNPDTTELYIAGSWKWISLKYSYSINNTFGIADNGWYLDLSANYPLNDNWTINAHVGRQEYNGSTNGVSNSVLNYTDWKLGVTYAINGWNFGAYWTDTNANSGVYTIAGRNISQSTGTAFVQKTF
jgi:uncharacterized protein (TIGR02001 family)